MHSTFVVYLDTLFFFVDSILDVRDFTGQREVQRQAVPPSGIEFDVGRGRSATVLGIYTRISSVSK